VRNFYQSPQTAWFIADLVVYITDVQAIASVLPLGEHFVGDICNLSLLIIAGS